MTDLTVLTADISHERSHIHELLSTATPTSQANPYQISNLFIQTYTCHLPHLHETPLLLLMKLCNLGCCNCFTMYFSVVLLFFFFHLRKHTTSLSIYAQ